MGYCPFVAVKKIVAPAEFQDFAAIVNNQTGTLLTDEEQVQGTAVEFGIAVDAEGNTTRVAADDASSIATISGKYHSEHGLTGMKVVVPVPGNVNILIGKCTYSGNTIKVTNSNNEEVITYTPQGEQGSGDRVCWKNNSDNVIELTYTGEATTLTITGMGYCPFVAVKKNEAPEPVATDVTATWDFANNCAKLAKKSEGGSYTAETMASDVEGIEMAIVYNGGVIKNNDNSYQVSTGVEMRIPVKNAGDEITVKGYPGYSKYTIGSSTEELTGDNTYKVKISDAEVSYVAVTSLDNNNYYYSISVTQYAPKEKTTLDNEPATATFAFNEGTEGQNATFSNADYFLNSKVIVGSNFSIEDKNNQSGFDQTRLKSASKETAAGATNLIQFLITPKPGFTFTPSKVSFKATRYGTDGGKMDIAWMNPDKTTVSLATGQTPNRENGKDANKVQTEYKYSEYYYELTEATAGEGTCGLTLNIYNLDKDKRYGFADIVIEGTLSGTEQELPILASFKINGNEYAVEDVFGDDYEATLKLSKKDAMVSAANPLTEVTATSGEVGTVTYEGTETACKVTIPVTAGSTTLDYVLNVIQKPDYTLSYIAVDGTTVLATQTREEGQAIGEFDYDIADVASSKDGYKARGWFKQNYLGAKFTTADVVTADTKLYAIETEIEVPSNSRKYEFNLADQLFYAEDHEAFTPQEGAQCIFHDTTHGWAVYNGDKIDLLVGPKAIISIGTCKYGHLTNILVKKGEETLATLEGMDANTDGKVVSYTYEGEPGTVTLEMVTTGESYIHNVKIANVAETNYDQDGQWFFVKAGDVSSLIDALEVANGTGGTERVFIFLPNGTYDLGTTVKTAISRDNISLIGESTEETIVKNAPPVSLEGLMSASTIHNTGSNLYMQDLTLQNDLDYYAAGSAGRANAFHDGGNKTIAKNVKLMSYQDTYLTPANKQTYLETSEIQGTVDFICGGGDIFFEKCDIVARPRYNEEEKAKRGEVTITAHQPQTAEKFGYVFNNCTIENQSAKFNLGRAWGGASGATVRPTATYLNTTLNQPTEINATRFITTGMNNQAGIFHEYNSIDKDGTVVSPSSLEETFTNKAGDEKITYDIILSAEQAAGYALDKVFTDWHPADYTIQLEAPDAEYANGNVTWTPADDGAIAYMIEKNGEFVGITTQSSYAIEIDAANDKLTIRSANMRGGFGPAKQVAGTATSVKAVNAAIERGEQVIYNLSGQRVNKATKGLYIVNGKKVVIK